MSRSITFVEHARMQQVRYFMMKQPSRDYYRRRTDALRR
jgi:hypothetical protein